MLGNTEKVANQKIDKRVKYTKMFIKEALLGLMEQKPVDQITITELCKQADINRNTFYTHFNTIKDALTMVEQELEESLFSELNLNVEDRTIIKQLFEHFKKNGNIYRILISSNGDFSFMYTLYSKIEQLVIEKYYSRAKTMDEEKIKMIFEFQFFGSISVVRRWLDSGAKQTCEEMADFLLTINSGAVNKFD